MSLPLLNTAPLLTFTAVDTSDRAPAKMTEATLALPVPESVSASMTLLIDTPVLEAANKVKSLPALKFAPDRTSTCVVPCSCAKPAPKLARDEPATCCSAPATRSAVAVMLRSRVASITAVPRTVTLASPLAST